MDKRIEEAINRFVIESNSFTARNASYALILKTGAVPHKSVGSVCHGDLEDWSSRNDLDYCILSRHQRPHTTKEDSLLYADWLVNRSPYADCFLTKDLEFIFNKGFLLNTRAPFNLMLGACMAHRFSTENYSNSIEWFKLWLRLKKETNFNENLIFVISQIYKQTRNGISLIHRDNHCPINPISNNLKYSKNFINNSPELLTIPFSEGGIYGDVNKTWGISEYRSLRDVISTIKIRGEKVNYNIFAPKSLKTNTLITSFDDFVDLIRQIEEHINNA